MKKACFVYVCAAVSAAATFAFAETKSSFNLNVNVGLPVVAAPAPVPPAPVLPPPGAPQVVLEVVPRFILSPVLGFYVSVGIPYDIVLIDNHYYLNRDGRWYRSGRYDGPWAEVRRKRLPPGLRKHRYEDIRRYRDEEYRRYEHDRDHYRGRWHEPGKHGHDKHDNGKHRGHHKGHDRD